MLQIGSLFSGAGLCDLGFHRAGFKHRWLCEIDPFCRSVLARHWPGIPIYEDIRDIDPAKLPTVDVLAGGFPCQDVSCSGKRAGIRQDTRSGLWYEYARFIKEIQPRYAVIENVRGLLSLGIETVLQDLAKIGYNAEWHVLSAADVGAPHRRERVFILAYPHSHQLNPVNGGLSSLIGDMGESNKHHGYADWNGIRLDRASRAALREAYTRCVLHRVDDGCSQRLDGSGWGISGRVMSISPTEYEAWLPRLKALGNGITPQQAYFVARAILRAEGFLVPDTYS
ncbi:MAG: DNA cytosine methyltransferase [Deltaproteobacteria bacterium]|jgi:DNA (cytosine-5)-methyltransferase 1|nr:DNA cytosine methyltransferase [Deltaproteobacteria bacterium]